MIHGGLGGVLVDRLPLAGAHVEGKGHGRRLRGYSVVSDTVVVVRIVGAAGKIDFLVFFRASCRDAVARRSRMAGQFRPLNFQTIVVVDLSHPALVRSDILRLGSGRVLVGAVNVHDGVAYDGAGVPEYGRSGDRRSLCPGILL